MLGSQLLTPTQVAIMARKKNQRKIMMMDKKQISKLLTMMQLSKNILKKMPAESNSHFFLTYDVYFIFNAFLAISYLQINFFLNL